jgi:hypothetical protein
MPLLLALIPLFDNKNSLVIACRVAHVALPILSIGYKSYSK